MDVLRYNELDISAVKKQYDTVVALLQQNNFASSGVEQFAGTPFYLVPLNPTQNLLFKVVSHQNKNCVLLLEIITEKAKSRFFHGIPDAKLDPISNHHFEQFSVDALS